MNHKWTVKLSIEGWMCQAFLEEDGSSSGDLEKAAVFMSVKAAHEAMSKADCLDKEWLLGYEVIMRGLCYPNP